MENEQQENVILVHGLWFGAWAMAQLSRRLERAGFRTRTFSYSTIREDLDTQTETLFRFAVDDAGAPPHFVAHSMGGLITLNMLIAHERARCGRTVLLGTPLQGSAVARKVSRWPGGRKLLGMAEDTLLRGVNAWPAGREVGMIAGTLPIGLGIVAGGARLRSDGTVLVEETRHPGLTDHVEIRTSHTGMLYSAAVARQAAAFLHHGRFEH